MSNWVMWDFVIRVASGEFRGGVTGCGGASGEREQHRPHSRWKGPLQEEGSANYCLMVTV